MGVSEYKNYQLGKRLSKKGVKIKNFADTRATSVTKTSAGHEVEPILNVMTWSN